MKPCLPIGMITLLGLLTACSGPEYQNQTARDWSTGSYVSKDDASSRSEHAARVLDRAPEKTDVTMQVETLRLPVHASPSIDSAVIGNLDRGDAVTVLEWSRFYNAPSADREAEGAPGRGIPTWAKVSNARIEGYVSARSLKSPSDFAPANSVAPDTRVLLSGSDGTPLIEGANYSDFEEMIGTASHPVTRYRLSRLVLEGWEPSMLERDRIDGFASVSLEEHDPERSMTERRMQNIVQPMPPLDPEMLASDSEGSFIDVNMVRRYLVENALETYLESDGSDPDLHLIIGRELGASMLSSGEMVPADDPRSIVVNAVGTDLASHSSNPYPHAGYVFILIDNDEVAEAVATPIGVIYLTTGMLHMLESDSELALILGHEIGHVEGGHGLEGGGNDVNHHQRLSAYRRVLALEAAGELEGHIDWVLAEVEIPEDFKQSVRKEIREELLAEARSRYIAGIENSMSELRHGSNRELEIAADARAMSLAAAAGYDPNRIVVLLDRFDTTSVPYGGAQYPRARRMAAIEILDQLAADTKDQGWSRRNASTTPESTSSIDRDILITCLENELTHEEIRERALPALDEDRASMMSEKVVMLEFTPPSEEPPAPIVAGTPLLAVLAPTEEPADAVVEIDLLEPEAEAPQVVAVSDPAEEDSLVDLLDLSTESDGAVAETEVVVATIVAAPAEENIEAEPAEREPAAEEPAAEEPARVVAVAPEAPTEIPMTPLEPAMPVAEEVREPEASGDADETTDKPEVVFDPEHFTRFVDRHEFNQQASPTDRSMFADFISRHSEKSTTFLRFCIRGHSELTIDGPFTDDTLALVIPENRKLRLWCVRDGSKHRIPDTRGSAHTLDSRDSSFTLVNTTGDPIDGWVVIGR